MQPNALGFQYSRGASMFDNQPAQHTSGSFDDFETAVLADQSERKGLAYICAPLAVGIHYQKPDKYQGEGHWRLKDYVEPRCFLPFDIDEFGNAEDFKTLRDFVSKYRGFCYTTASHTDDAPRARLILQASRPVGYGECVAVCQAIEAELAACIAEGGIKFDGSVYRGEQPIYTPVKTSLVFRFFGVPVDVDTLLGMRTQTEKLRGSLLQAMAVPSGFELPETVEDGEGRESVILRHASSLRAQGLQQGMIERACLDYNQLHIKPPLDVSIVLDRARRYQEAPQSPPADDAWPVAEEIKTNLPPVPQLEEYLLPKGFRPWVKDIAERMQCPIEYLAVGAMVAAGAAIGNRVGIQPKQRDTGWVEVPNLWGAVIGRPGVMKSPALSQILAPLKRIESELLREFSAVKCQYEMDRMIYDATKKKISSLIGKGNSVSPDMLPVEPESPQPKRLLVNDATYQKLGQVLSGNPNGLLVFQDELSGLLRRLDLEGQEAARAFYLEAWDGKQGYTFDRVERGTVRIPRLCFSMLGGLQPSKLREYLRSAVTGGSGDDGLAQRLQLLVYPDIKQEWFQVDRLPDIAAAEHAEGIFERLVKLDPLSLGAVQNHPEAIPVFRFDEAAQEKFNKWWSLLENSLRREERHPALESHLSKYRKLVPAIALIDHLVSGRRDSIRVESVSRAMLWHNYLFAHAERAYAVVTSSVMDSAVMLSQRIKAGLLSDGFTVRDVYRKGWSQLSSGKEASEAVGILAEAGWLRGVRDSSGAALDGKPTVRYYINPSVKKAA